MEESLLNSKQEQKSKKSIKIKSIQANSLYTVNNYVEDKNKTENKKPYLDLGEAVINSSLFSKYMLHHAVAVNKKGRSKDFIVMKFDYGIKGGMSSKELREYYYENGADVAWNTYEECICFQNAHFLSDSKKGSKILFITAKGLY